MDKETQTRRMSLFEDLSNVIDTDKYNIADIIRAASMLIADCVAQSDITEETEEKTYNAIIKDIKYAVATLKEIYKEV